MMASLAACVHFHDMALNCRWQQQGQQELGATCWLVHAAQHNSSSRFRSCRSRPTTGHAQRSVHLHLLKQQDSSM